jgi:hypothetical protein
VAIMKIKGDSGSSCRIPLEGLKVGKGEPFTRMEKKAKG